MTTTKPETKDTPPIAALRAALAALPDAPTAEDWAALGAACDVAAAFARSQITGILEPEPPKPGLEAEPIEGAISPTPPKPGLEAQPLEGAICPTPPKPL
jgi:hypothetical protein